MLELDIKKLTSCGSDWETNRYLLLKKLREWQNQLNRNRVCTVLKEAWEMKDKLDDLLIENIESKGWLEREVQGLLIEDNIIVNIEKAKHISTELDKLIHYVEWAIESVEYIIREGIIISEFLHENISISTIENGLNYKGKGYFLLPDNKKEVIKIYSYETIFDWNDNSPEEMIEINLLRSIPMLLVSDSYEKVMMEFVKHSQKMYMPTVFICNTDLDFPFNETILPIVKQKINAEISK